MIWPEIKLVWVEVGAEAQLRDKVAVWQPRCEVAASSSTAVEVVIIIIVINPHLRSGSCC